MKPFVKRSKNDAADAEANLVGGLVRLVRVRREDEAIRVLRRLRDRFADHEGGALTGRSPPEWGCVPGISKATGQRIWTQPGP